MQTFRELHFAYITENPHNFTKNLLRNLKQCVTRYGDVLDMEYDKITDEMLNEGICAARTDYARTQIAFLIHEFDRETGAAHHLEYDKMEEQGERA